MLRKIIKLILVTDVSIRAMNVPELNYVRIVGIIIQVNNY